MLFNSDIVNFVWKTDEGESERTESIALLIFALCVALIVVCCGVVGWGRNSYLGPAEIASFSSWDLSRRNKHDSFWLILLTGYFYILFL